MRFEFATAGRIVFGEGVAGEAAAIAAEYGRRALVVTGSTAHRAQPVLDGLTTSGVDVTLVSVSGEPTFDTARQAVDRAQQGGCQLVVGCGGGSALDVAKIVAAMVTNGGDPLDYAEVIGWGKALLRPSLPFIALPTTAGTGTEVTRNAVLASPEHRVKVSLRSPFLLPTVALVDPELTYGLPAEVTASTGMDALTQLIEPYLSARSSPMSEPFSVEGMRRVARSLRRACQAGEDADARLDMALASLFGGLALANAGLGAVHGIAGPFGGMYPRAPHGAVCARLLVPVTAVSLSVAERHDPGGRVVQRYADIARLLTGRPQAEPQDGVRWLARLCADLEIPGLAALGLESAEIPALIERSLAANSMRTHAVNLTAADLEEILRRAMGTAA